MKVYHKQSCDIFTYKCHAIFVRLKKSKIIF